MSRIKDCARKTFLAMRDPSGSVEEVFPSALDAIEEDNDCQYMGVKNVRQIPPELIDRLEENGFVLHTLDSHSHNGRAIDGRLRNPITARPMTGSSSGTALNVFLGINDLGVGTDGGGSVLAPAIAVNCYGFICPLIEGERMARWTRESTDGIAFYPSAGFITRDLATMRKAIQAVLDLPAPGEGTAVAVSSRFAARFPDPDLDPIGLPEAGNAREPLIEFLAGVLPGCDVFADYEEKIDFYGLGDSVFGHFDPETQALQERSGKGLIRVANMVKATALTIPVRDLSSAITLYCESKPQKIARLLEAAQRLAQPEDELVRRYFRDPAAYFEKGFIWHH